MTEGKQNKIVEAVIIAGLSALVTGIIGIVVKKIEKLFEKESEPEKPKKKVK